MNRYAEALLFGVASLGSLGIMYLVLVAGSAITGGEGTAWRGFTVLASLVQIAALASLAFVAGRRRSSLDLAAIIIFSLVGPIVGSAVL